MTQEHITPELFKHLVRLAALALDDNEGEYLRCELNNQLGAIRELEAVSLDDDVGVTAYGVPYTVESTPALREDVWQPYDNVAGIMGQAPRLEDGYIVVPDIPHETLE
jgi:aspartyl-tRNA(Asn)/glutamyl-tRNA(Gln) amidotransferase subunit C